MKILIGESNSGNRDSLAATFTHWGYKVETASSGKDALAALGGKDGPKLAVLSSTLLDPSGAQVCREIRKKEDEAYIYIFMLIPAGDASGVQPAVEAGADDCLMWPLAEAETKARLRAARRILGLRTQLEEAQAALNYQVSHDPLTGLMNRAAILDALSRELARVRREKSPVGVIKVGIDNFKDMNRQYGTAAGDAAIRGAARRLRAALRPYDSVGRFGTEGFLILVPGSDIRETLAQAERLRVAVASATVQVGEWGGHAKPEQSMLSTTISLGVASSSQTQEADRLVRAAESALERARAGGPNRVEIATPQELTAS